MNIGVFSESKSEREELIFSTVQTGSADHVHGNSGNLIGKACLDGSLTSYVLAKTSLDHATHEAIPPVGMLCWMVSTFALLPAIFCRIREALRQLGDQPVQKN